MTSPAAIGQATKAWVEARVPRHGSEVRDPLAAMVSMAQRGDEQAFGRLIEATERDVYNVAYSVLRNPQEAEDMCQEVFLRVWRALDTFKGQSKFKTWLYRVTVNACLNRKRSLRAQLRTVDDDTLLERQIAKVEGPSGAVERIDRQTLIWNTVNELPEKYRLVITLFYQQQMSYNEIADALALPLGTVKAHLNRARKALAKALEQYKEADRVLV